jgi:DNA polymerase III subunit epsilon
VEFAVLDFETTGLMPQMHDRVIEVAIVRVDERGETLAEFDTLINPGRDVGPTAIHGIEAWEVADAPTFAEVVGDILTLIDGAVLVAHNARFDSAFLDYELGLAGYAGLHVDPLCTMELLHAIEPLAPRKLRECCEHFGLECGTAHHALEDVRMTARLLHCLLGRWQYPALPASRTFDIKPERCPRCCRRGSGRPPTERQGTFLAGLVSRLPGGAPTLRASAAGAEYLNLLDGVLEDRRVTELEAELLISLAGMHGLSAREVAALHDDYMRHLVAIALEDSVITDSERRDLNAIGMLLGTPDWAQLITENPCTFPQPAPALPPTSTATVTRTRPAAGQALAEATPRTLAGGLAPGMTVCFTGAMEYEREEMQAIAAAAGLVVKTGVSGKLDVLVIADPDSQSGKARKARALGTRLVSEAAFLQMVRAAETLSLR